MQSRGKKFWSVTFFFTFIDLYVCSIHANKCPVEFRNDSFGLTVLLSLTLSVVTHFILMEEVFFFFLGTVTEEKEVGS